jgi:hypothetical protein
MCTLALLANIDGFILWHSRDEHRARLPGLPPRVERSQGIGWIAPADSEAGGTWIGVNTAGVATGIANLFVGTRPVPPAVKVSRGLLVRGLLGLNSSRQVERTVTTMNLSAYEPFTLVSVETGRRPIILRWDRAELRPAEPLGGILLVTSAGGHRAIEEARRQLFFDLEQRGPVRADAIERLYRAEPDSEGKSIGVSRADVATVSLTRIEVAAGQVGMVYTPGLPSRTAGGAPVVLQR